MFDWFTENKIKNLPTKQIETIRDSILQEIAIASSYNYKLLDRLDFVQKILDSHE